MKELWRFMVCGFAGFLAMMVHAHEGHDHGPVSIKSALEISVKAVKSYTVKASSFEVAQLPASWVKVTEQNAKIHENKLGYYIVSVRNPEEEQNIYLKILLDGTVAGANYSGNFADSSAKSSSAHAVGG